MISNYNGLILSIIRTANVSSAVFMPIALASALQPSYPILLLDKSSFSSVLFSSRASPMATAQTSPKPFQDKFRDRNSSFLYKLCNINQL